MSTINTSRAKQVGVRIFDFDNIPISATYTTNGVAIDLTNYSFEFHLKTGQKLLKTYSIASGSLTSTYLNKTGDDINVLEMEAMWEDIRNSQVDTIKSKVYRLIQVVTDSSNIHYVYIVYNIHADKY